jgi:hypothetical protein
MKSNFAFYLSGEVNLVILFFFGKGMIQVDLNKSDLK